MQSTTLDPPQINQLDRAVQQTYQYLLSQYGQQSAENYLKVVTNGRAGIKGLPKPRIERWYAKRHKQQQSEIQERIDELWKQRLSAVLVSGEWLSYRQISDRLKEAEGKHPNPAELRDRVGRLARIGWLKEVKGSHKRFSIPRPFEVGDRVIEFFGNRTLEKHGEIIEFRELAQAGGGEAPVIRFDDGSTKFSNVDFLIHEFTR